MLDVWQGEQTNLMIDLACWPCCNSPYFILEEFLVKCSSSDLVHTHSHSRFPSSLARFNLRRLGRSPTGSENREPRKILWFIIIWKMTTFLGVNPHFQTHPFTATAQQFSNPVWLPESLCHAAVAGNGKIPLLFAAFSVCQPCFLVLKAKTQLW